MLILIIGVSLFIGAKFSIFSGLITFLLLTYIFKDNLDAGLSNSSKKDELNAKFIENIFGLFGNMAKAKGFVEQADLYSALDLMREMQVTPENEFIAKTAFNKGKEAGFDFDAKVLELKNLFKNQAEVLNMILELLVSVALIDDDIHPNEKKLLIRAAKILGFSLIELNKIIKFVRARIKESQSYNFEENFNDEESKKSQLDMAYEILELDKNVAQAEAKKQYKRLISKNHPDKLIAKKVPEKLIEIAKEKTQKINQAYDLICRVNNW